MQPKTIITIAAIGLVLVANQGATQDQAAISDLVSANPGARAMGLGGAFAALADDATAAFANPAGLIQLPRPEISAEARFTLKTVGSGTPFDFTPDISGVGFFSFVYPHRNWVLALYSHQLASIEVSVVAPSIIVSELNVRSYAAAAAFEVTESLSLGIGLSYFDGDRDSSVISAGVSDSDWGVNAGILWKVSRAWSLAGFYRQGPEFDVDVPLGRKSSPAPTALRPMSIGASSQLAFPDVYGVGVAVRPRAGALILGFEWDHVETGFESQEFGSTLVEGGDEFHVGAEYAVLRWRPVVAFRAGIWSEPDRRRVWVTGFDTFIDAGTGDQTHLSLGFGLAFTRIQFDVGLDLSERMDVLSLSMVYSF